MLLRAARGHAVAGRRVRGDESRSTAPTSAASTPGRPWRTWTGRWRGPTHRAAGRHRLPRSRAARRRLRLAVRELVPDGDPPAGGARLRACGAQQTVVGQRERLLALGTAHRRPHPRAEQPGAAAVRATAALRERGRPACGTSWPCWPAAARPGSSPSWSTWSRRTSAAAAARRRSCPRWRPPTARTSSATGWTDHGVSDAWDLAPPLVAAGVDAGCLERVAGAVPAGRLPYAGGAALAHALSRPSSCCDEIEDAPGASRPSSARPSSTRQLDRAPHQVVDVHDGLDTTLIMLAARSARASGGQGLRPVAAGDPRLRRPSSTRCGPT